MKLKDLEKAASEDVYNYISTCLKEANWAELHKLYRYFYDRWKSDRWRVEYRTRISTELRKKNERLTKRWQNLRLANSRMSYQLWLRKTSGEPLSEQQVLAKQAAMDKELTMGLMQLLKGRDEEIAALTDACKRVDGINMQLHAEIQQLKQLLATQQVPVPNNPGMPFISHQN